MSDISPPPPCLCDVKDSFPPRRRNDRRNRPWRYTGAGWRADETRETHALALSRASRETCSLVPLSPFRESVRVGRSRRRNERRATREEVVSIVSSGLTVAFLSMIKSFLCLHPCAKSKKLTFNFLLESIVLNYQIIFKCFLKVIWNLRFFRLRRCVINIFILV